MDEDILEKLNVVYLLTNKINSMRYVGITTQKLKNRLRYHKNNSDTYIGRAIKKYGWENFSVEILEECTSPEELFEREKYWIKTLNTKNPNGYNLTDGGEGLNGCKHSQKTRKKMSERHYKCAVICTSTGEIFPSIKAAAEHFGITHGSVTAVCKAKCLSINGLKFDYVDEEKRAAAEIKRKKLSPMKQPVLCLETGKIYESAVAASKETGIYRRAISFACAGKHSTAGGLHWIFLDEEKRAAAEIALKKITPRNEKTVRCIETNVVYPSIKAASEETGINRGSISNVCCYRAKTAGGYHWRFVSED